MATISAKHFGAHNAEDRFGTPLLANNGNGELYGENVEIETFSSSRSEKLNDIMELRAQMAMSPLEGDDLIHALLDVDEQLIMEGRINRQLITETYPDIDVGQYLLDLLVEDDNASIAVGEIVEKAIETNEITAQEFPGSPEDMLHFLEELGTPDADNVIQVLLDRCMADQIDAIKTKSHHDALESPFVAA